MTIMFTCLLLAFMTNLICSQPYTVSFDIFAGEYPNWTNLYLENNSTGLNEITVDPLSIPENTIAQYNVAIDSSCFTFRLSTSSTDVIEEVGSDIYTWQPSFALYLENSLLSLPNQTYSNVRQESSKVWTEISFCANIEDSNNTLEIKMEGYPSNLKLEITRFIDVSGVNNYITYSNTFGLNGDFSTVDTIANNNLKFKNMPDGCYTITFTDEYYDNGAIDISILNHIKYNVSINNNIVAFGGYYKVLKVIHFAPIL